MNKKTLDITHPGLLKEWDYTKNDILPSEITAGSGRIIKWICSEGHSWETPLYSRTGKKRSGCPYCSNKKVLKGYNDLTTTNPELAKEWDYIKNNTLPIEIIAGSNKKKWWICRDNHSWEARIDHRTIMNSGCPYCTNQKVLAGYNDFKTMAKKNNQRYLLKEWDADKNQVKPNNITYKTDKKIHWKCEKGHEWEAAVNNRTNGQNCPKCSVSGTSFVEQYIYHGLKEKFEDVENRVKIESMEFDILVKDINLLIEYDGRYYHRVLNNTKERENTKEKLARDKGYDFIRIVEVERNTEIRLENNIIYYKNRSNNDDTNNIIKVIIEYINKKHLLEIVTETSSDVAIKAIKGSKNIRYEDSLEAKYPEIANRWDNIKNKGFRACDITPGSGVKAWFIDRNGESKLRSIYNVVNSEKRKLKTA